MLVPAHIVLLIENYFAHTRMKLFRDKGETNAILGMGLMLASGTETRIDWLESNLEVALARARWWSRRTSGSAPDGGREEHPGVLRMVVAKNLRGCSGWWSRRTSGGAQDGGREEPPGELQECSGLWSRRTSGWVIVQKKNLRLSSGSLRESVRF